MPTIPIVVNFDTQRIPIEGKATFVRDASYIWSTLPQVINSFNTAMGFINSNVVAVASNAHAVAIAHSATATARNEALNASHSAIGARNAIQDYVIPSNVTYSKEELDESFANIGNNILLIQQDQLGLKLNIKVV